jgi:4-amino-4-deoxy-L-arabinose transferase-like glycosyltransferase
MINSQNQSQQMQLHVGVFWLILVFVSLFSRSFMPIDETRYVTVAWNMFLNHDFLVPYLNGETYSHKPPLLFWLMNIGWAVFGVNDWWPRLLPSIFALGAVLITQKIATRLWPERPQIGYVASLILLGSGMWAVFTTATMFDMLVAFFTIWGALGLLVAWQGEAKKGWMYVALAIAGGLLAKGPTILLQILPLAVLAPWWMGNSTNKPNLRHWYLSVLIAVVVGALILLAWAIPAGIYGGPKYQHEIFWGQTADRMVKSFAHRRPIYWYLPMLPVMLFPWLFALPVWRALGKAFKLIDEQGVRFCLAWFIPVFAAFSFISGKQPHYLLPIMPAFALLVGRGWGELNHISWLDKLLIAIVGVGVGVLLLAMPSLKHQYHLAIWLADIPVWTGAVVVLGSVLLMLSAGASKIRYFQHVALLGLLLISMLWLGVIRTAGEAYDVRPISYHLKKLQDEHIPLAHIGHYYGQFNFVGRLIKSPEVLSESQLTNWLQANPQGQVVMYFDKTAQLKAPNLKEMKPEFKQLYRGSTLVCVLTKTQWQSLFKQSKLSTSNEVVRSE